MAQPHAQPSAKPKRASPTRSAPAAPPVHWDDDEKQALSAESFRLRRADPSLTKAALMLVAQANVLPAHRRRNVTTVAKYEPWLTAHWAALEQRDARLATAVAAQQPHLMAELAALPTPPAPGADAPPKGPRGIVAGTTVTRWTDFERHKVVAEAYAILQRPRAPQQIDAVRQAMASVLPAERQRDLPNWFSVKKWVVPLLAQFAAEDAEAKRAAKEAKLAAKEAEAAQIAEAEAQVDASQATHAPDYEAPVPQGFVPDWRYLQPPAPPPELGLEGIIQLLADKLASTFVAAIEGALRKAIVGQLGGLVGSVGNLAAVPSAMPTMPAHRPSVPVPPRERLPRVTIVGLYSQQEDDMRRAFLGTIEFIFVKSHKEGGNGHGGVGMLTKSSTSDLVIAMADHIGHDVTNCAKQLKVPFERLSGNTAALKRWLTVWLSGEHAQSVAA